MGWHAIVWGTQGGGCVCVCVCVCACRAIGRQGGVLKPDTCKDNFWKTETSLQKKKKKKSPYLTPLLNTILQLTLRWGELHFCSTYLWGFPIPTEGGRWQLLCPPPCLWLSSRQSQQFQPTLLPLTLATLWEKKKKKNLVELPITSSYTTHETTCNHSLLSFFTCTHFLRRVKQIWLCLLRKKAASLTPWSGISLKTAHCIFSDSKLALNLAKQLNGW